MKIKYKKPLFWWVVSFFHPGAEWGKVIFAFGDTIYTAKILNEAELAHEKVHLKQHKHSKMYAFFFALMCTISKKFFLKAEIEAYQAENKIKPNPFQYARSLSSKVYNDMITYEEALKLFQ